MYIPSTRPVDHVRAARLLVGMLDDDTLQIQDVLDSAALDVSGWGRSGLVTALAVYCLELLGRLERLGDPPVTARDELSDYLIRRALAAAPQDGEQPPPAA